MDYLSAIDFFITSLRGKKQLFFLPDIFLTIVFIYLNKQRDHEAFNEATGADEFLMYRAITSRETYG